MATQNYQGLLLTSMGEVKRANVQISGTNLNEADIQKYLRRKEQPAMIKKYQNGKKYYTLWGYFENTISGKKGNLNQSKFPSHTNSIIEQTNTSAIIGDILLIAHGDHLQNTYSVTIQEWNDFVEGKEISENEIVQPTKQKKTVSINSAPLPIKSITSSTTSSKTKQSSTKPPSVKPKPALKTKTDKSVSAQLKKSKKKSLDSDDEDEKESTKSCDDEKDEMDGEEDESDVQDSEQEEDADDEANTEVDDEEGADGDEDILDDPEDPDPDNHYFVEDLEEEREIQAKRKKKNSSKNADNLNLKEELTPESPYEVIPIRTNFIQTFRPIFADIFQDESLSETLERAMYHNTLSEAEKKFIPKNWKSVSFQGQYKQAAQQIFWNLHPQSPIFNKNLIRRIKENEFPLENIVNMTAYELAPEKWREMADRQFQREQKILEGDKSRSTDQFKCHRCGKRECSFYELQTRSADEPMTQFITCLNCGKRWRQ